MSDVIPKEQTTADCHCPRCGKPITVSLLRPEKMLRPYAVGLQHCKYCGGTYQVICYPVESGNGTQATKKPVRQRRR